jgi:AhpD family alkylhydroperoxidase
MKSRIEQNQAAKAFPDGMKAMVALEAAIQNSGLEKSLIHLVKIRASQINGCAYCINMHTGEARAAANASSGSICSTPGTNRRFIPSVNARRWPGPKRRRWSRKRTSPTRRMRPCASSSARRKSPN